MASKLLTNAGAYTSAQTGRLFICLGCFGVVDMVPERFPRDTVYANLEKHRQSQSGRRAKDNTYLRPGKPLSSARHAGRVRAATEDSGSVRGVTKRGLALAKNGGSLPTGET